MEVRNCRSCGRLFNYIGGNPICDRCKKQLEEKFHEVKEFLQEKPNSTITEVSEEMDVSVKQIRAWIREERLVLSEAGADGITCEQCGKAIQTGRFCDRCKKKMANEFAGTLVKPKEPENTKREKDGNRMRFLQ